MADPKERRRYKRIPSVFPVIFLPNSDIRIKSECSSIDISEGGIGLLITREPLTGKEVEVRFTLPNSLEELKINCQVGWSRASAAYKGRFESGITFTNLSDEKKRILKEYVEKNTPYV